MKMKMILAGLALSLASCQAGPERRSGPDAELIRTCTDGSLLMADRYGQFLARGSEDVPVSFAVTIDEVCPGPSPYP